MSINKAKSNKFFILSFICMALFAVSSFPALAKAASDDQPEVTTKNATDISDDSATLIGKVNGNGSSTKAWFEYGRDKDLDESTSRKSVGSGITNNFEFDITDLREDSTYYFRVVAQNDEGTDYGSILHFRTDVRKNSSKSDETSEVTAVTEPATPLSGGGIELNSLILTPSSNSNSTTAWFEWGTSTSLGNKTKVKSLGSTSSSWNAEIIWDLAPGTVYYFRAVAENSGSLDRGSILNFTIKNSSENNTVKSVNTSTSTNTRILSQDTYSSTTLVIPISAETAKANPLSTEVVLEGLINPNGNMTTAWFEYGTDKNLSISKDTVHMALGSGYQTFAFSETVEGLEPGTVYYFRILADNGKNEIRGDIVPFVTNSGPVQPAETVSSSDRRGTYATLGANSVFGENFLPRTLIGWLVLILIIFGLVIAVGKLYSRNSTEDQMNSSHFPSEHPQQGHHQ